MLTGATEGSVLSSKPNLFPHKLLIWPSMWYCDDWWNAWQFEPGSAFRWLTFALSNECGWNDISSWVTVIPSLKVLCGISLCYALAWQEHLAASLPSFLAQCHLQPNDLSLTIHPYLCCCYGKNVWVSILGTVKHSLWNICDTWQYSLWCIAGFADVLE